ncbi:MAG: PQQ-binding-like beta-propeller repeat protein, partial [Planctomycetota bacterium]|nr:PQQ-binding-like beta-propeller repeat protein [Planctomycetota bacterium]
MQRLLLLVIPFLMAAGWPTYQGDVRRSGIAKETLPAELERVWTFHSPHAPRPAWPAPAPGDVAHKLRDLRAVLAFDRAFQTVAADGAVFFGSSADDKVYALDAATGKVRWSFITGGPVRLAPAFADGKLYVGSDDGYVYCLSADDGRLLWRQLVHGPKRMLPGNGRVISAWPVRSSVVVIDGIAYAAAGLFPKEGVYLAAFDAETGKSKWNKKIDASTQGYMLASDQRLYVPTGRTTPAVFDRANGKQIGKLPGQGGTYALVMENCVVCGPGVRRKAISVADSKSSETIASFDGLSMIVDGHIAYMLSEDALTALDRTKYLELARERHALTKEKKTLEERLKKKKPDAETVKKIKAELQSIRKQLAVIAPKLPKCTLWKMPCDCPGAMIFGGKTLYLGGPNKIIAIDTEKGEPLWELKTEGNVNGLAIADGRLLATTDKGAIHCFAKTQAAKENVVQSAVSKKPFADGAGKSDHAKWYEMVAKEALRDLPVELGYCLVLGSGDGRLIYELARQSKLKIVCIEPDAQHAVASRRTFDRAGLQGTRVAFIHSPLDKWPLPSCFANLIVAAGASPEAKLPSSESEVARVLRPCGGRFVLAIPNGKNTANSRALIEFSEWAIDDYSGFQFFESDDMHCCIITRKRLLGSGDWTHTFSDAANTSCSRDRLVGREIQVQWFGRPGPRRMVDRHFRNVPPLYKDGRLFVPGNNIIYGVDAYNGTVNWQAETPNSLRVGGFLDPSNMTVDEKYLYLVAEDKCHRFDVRSGKRDVLAELPKTDGKKLREWGYIAAVGDRLLGSSRSSDTSYHTLTLDAQEVTQPVWFPNMSLALSHEVFAINPADGRRKWTY